MGECVAMMIWQWPISSMRRISFKNSIWRAGDSADSGSSKMKMFEEAQKAFAVGVREKIGWRTASDAGNFFEVDRVQVSRNGKETLGPKKPAIGDFRQPARTKCRRQPSTHLLQRIRMIDWFVTLGTAGLVIAGEHGDAFKQRGFAGAVFADDDGDSAVEAQFEIIA